MANTDRPNGLTPVRYLSGGTVITHNKYLIANGYTSAIYSGDPVKSTGTSKNMALAVAGNTMRGVFAGCEYTDSAGNRVQSKYWPASTVSTDAICYVYDDPNILFEVQADEDIEAADIGATTDLVAGTGSALTGRSAYELDSSQIGSDAGVLIYELVDRVDNAYGTNAKVLVLINEHELRAGTFTAT